MPGRAPFTVVFGGLDKTPARFDRHDAARSHALGVANREDVQCSITDRFGNSELVVRSGPVDPLRREFDPYRGQPFFHPHPQHPRSRERFLRNEPEAWTPGIGPAQTEVRPREFFAMHDLADPRQSGALAALVPPLLLFGVVAFLARPRDLGELAQEDVVTADLAPRRRAAARRLYGSAVLAAQASGSMKKLAVEIRDRTVAEDALELQRMSRRLLDRAFRFDRKFVQAKLSM